MMYLFLIPCFNYLSIKLKAMYTPIVKPKQNTHIVDTSSPKNVPWVC